ncbi:MAG: diacylglycerol kinase family protein [Dysosmobacter sp.]
MKHVFIINPTAGKSDSRQKIYDMAEKLRQDHGLDVQCILTKQQGHATEIAHTLCARPARSCDSMPAAATAPSTRWPTASSATTTPP